MPRAKPQPSGLGIEDELSFGSDEDLLAEVGEINLAQQGLSSPHQSNVNQSDTNGKAERTKSSGKFKLGVGKDKDKRKRTATDETIKLSHQSTSSKRDNGKSLAKSSLVIDPLLVESVLDVSASANTVNSPRASGLKNGSRNSLSMSSSTKSPSLSITSSSKHDLVSLSAVGGGKKKGFMSSLRSLGGNKDKKEDMQYRYGNGIGHNKPHRPDLASIRSRDSFGTRSDISRQQSFDLGSNNTYSSSDHSMQKHTLAPISMSPFQGHPPDWTPDSATRSSISASSSSKRPSISSFARRASVITSTSFATSENYNPGEESPILSKANITSLAIPPSPQISSHIFSVLLPSFPATISALSSIQILQATVIRKILPISGMPDKEKSTSLKSLTSVLSSSNGGSGNQSTRKPIWITQQLVLTSFKIGGSTPTSTPEPDEYLSKPSTSRTIAHLHLFSIPGGSSQSGFSRRPSLPSNAMSEENELERRIISHDCTAGVCNEDENGRKFVMRIGFGESQQDENENEWIVEMRNADQTQEWIRQIKSIAVVVRAEREGHGHAIRNAYSDAIRGDDLSLELDLQRNSSPSIKSPTSRSNSVVPSQRNSAISEMPIPEACSMERSSSAARAESPDMLPPTPIVEEISGQLCSMNLGPEVLPTARIRSKSFNKGQFDIQANAVSPSSSNASGGLGGISRIGGSLHRHAKKDSWSSSTSGGSSILPRRYGGLQPPPPPMAPPPNVPLPALPNGSSASPSASRTAMHNQMSNQSPSPEGQALSQDNANRTKHQNSSPLSSSSGKERSFNTFKPIPLVPEMESNPKMNNNNLNNSPIIVDSPSKAIIRSPTPPRKSTKPVENTEVEGFYTPETIETPTLSLSNNKFTSTGIEGGESNNTLDSILSTPNTMNNEFNKQIDNENEDNKHYASSINSFTPSFESKSTTNSSARRRREKKIAIDIMSEFNENPDAAFLVDGEEEIKEDRPRVIRFA
uniref:Uncharacterized protein n=1 Tax=Kwoniella pini CBS 10737 TaxID=1296096 RepID=A0A1B9I6D0_9TREE|nr:uncharacterized protein I206_03161 [Kwoniella pini CBS 10737]OCF51095.1 hypothetical protein I206_03161 [Kwoniella pini CBS 10737]